jgi:hypothetical protein
MAASPKKARRARGQRRLEIFDFLGFALVRCNRRETGASSRGIRLSSSAFRRCRKRAEPARSRAGRLPNCVLSFRRDRGTSLSAS